MASRDVVRCVLRHGTDVLLVRRNDAVASDRGRWGGVSGSVAGAAPEAAARRVIDRTVGLLDAARSDHRAAAPVNLAFDAFTVLSTPPTLQLRYDEPIGGHLHERVIAAREVLDRRGDAAHETHLLGLVRLSVGTVD